MRLSIFVLVIAIIMACAQDQLLVKNPGFELDEDGDGMPDHWRISWRSTHSSDSARGIQKQEPDWEMFMSEVYDVTDVLVLHDGPTLHRGTLDMDEWWSFLDKAQADGKTVWFYNIDLTAWHPEPMRYMYGFGLWKSKATGVIEWAYMWPVDPEQPQQVYSKPGALLFRFPEAPGRSGGPTIGYEAIREGIDDYRYLLTLKKLVERAKASENPQAAPLADKVWAPVQQKLDEAGFECCTGSAAQGNWTGECEYLPDGNRVVRGDHKIPNGWEFGDYPQLRRLIAQGITELSRAIID